MARTLHFRGQQIGDHVVVWSTADQLATPPAVLAGLYRQTAGINADSRNLVRGLAARVSWAKSTPELLAQAVAAVHAMQGLTGDVQIKLDGVVKVTGEDWVLVEAPPPGLLDGYGGRFTDQLALLFHGEPALQFA